MRVPAISIVAIDGSGPRAGIAVLDAAGETRARRVLAGRPGLIETLPVALRDCLDEAKLEPGAVAVTIGPGSFTGLRTAIALARGFAAAAGLPLLAVTVAEAFAQAFPTMHRPLWVALRARRGRIFLLRDGEAVAFADADIPRTRVAVAVAGDAANDVVARLAAAGDDVLLTNARGLDPVWVARAAQGRLAAGVPAREALPLYVDPPEARLPGGGRALAVP